MDIIPQGKSKDIYQNKNGKTKSVLDLRCFSSGKNSENKPIERKNRIIVMEIVRKKTEKNKIIAKKNREIQNMPAENIRCPKREIEKEISQNNSKVENGINFQNISLIWKKSFLSFLSVTILISLTIFSLSFLQKGIEQKENFLLENSKAYEHLKSAGKSIYGSDFQSGINSFGSAAESFSNSKKMIDDFGMGLTKTISGLPVDTPVSTARNLTQAGENISKAGESIAELIKKLSALNLNKDSFSSSLVLDFQPNVDSITKNLKNAEKNMEEVNTGHIPSDMREKIKLIKTSLPLVAKNFENLSNDLPYLSQMLGDKYSQKYLLIFENNSEIRATGGFIGSYGILDLENGKIKNLFFDDIFNPDGQLKEKIIPPMPIQKISAAWSMHDANWFADFPTSAKKVASFYEKTGGPTVDGVIAITPDVIEKILEITGPIAMPEYGVIVDKNNFILQTQLQVEELYDKEENKPKKFLSDLAPKIMEKLSAMENLDYEERIEKYLSFISIIEECLKEKHIILYHRNPDIENTLIKRGWAGQLLNSSGDYLSVVHSNINGYKTDAVIKESISHESEILSDGSIIDTVKIKRIHTGGEKEYSWYNRVNSDYMRVYVPLGSTLLEASGQTIQEYEPPIDYGNFKTDYDVEKIENTIKIDPDSQTQIFEESGKTVFGNWVYVSPQEEVEVIYKYKLPFKINFDDFTKPADKFSLLVQKQLGSKGTDFSGKIKIPENWEIIWESENLKLRKENEAYFEKKLKKDMAYGIVFANSSE